jgi:uncharacterized OB-fold protein
VVGGALPGLLVKGGWLEIAGHRWDIADLNRKRGEALGRGFNGCGHQFFPPRRPSLACS